MRFCVRYFFYISFNLSRVRGVRARERVHSHWTVSRYCDERYVTSNGSSTPFTQLIDVCKFTVKVLMLWSALTKVFCVDCRIAIHLLCIGNEVYSLLLLSFFNSIPIHSLFRSFVSKQSSNRVYKRTSHAIFFSILFKMCHACKRRKKNARLWIYQTMCCTHTDGYHRVYERVRALSFVFISFDTCDWNQMENGTFALLCIDNSTFDTYA